MKAPISETAYILATNLAKLRAAQVILGDVLAGDAVEEYAITIGERAAICRQIDAAIERTRASMEVQA